MAFVQKTDVWVPGSTRNPETYILKDQVLVNSLQLKTWPLTVWNCVNCPNFVLFVFHLSWVSWIALIDFILVKWKKYMWFSIINSFYSFNFCIIVLNLKCMHIYWLNIHTHFFYFFISMAVGFTWPTLSLSNKAY